MRGGGAVMLTFFHLKVAAYQREEAYLRGGEWGGGGVIED